MLDEYSFVKKALMFEIVPTIIELKIVKRVLQFLTQLWLVQFQTLRLFLQKNTHLTFLCLKKLRQISKPFFYNRIFNFTDTKNLPIALAHQIFVFSVYF